MPGAIAETKSTPWTVAEQFVEERIKLKQGNSRVALALRNAKYIDLHCTFLPKSPSKELWNAMTSIGPRITTFRKRKQTLAITKNNALLKLRENLRGIHEAVGVGL